jgi:signal transduction histidine kinase
MDDGPLRGSTVIAFEGAFRGPPPPERRRPPLVLVVDDDASMCERCARVLSAHGFSVTAAHDGDSALDAMVGGRPDVMIVDLHTTGMSGEEFLDRAREIDPALVAVAIADCPNPCAAIRELKAGASDCLRNPFRADDLTLVIERALDRRRLAKAVAEGERERTRMHDHFVAMVSHQLKSPAAAIKECLDAVTAAFGDGLAAECRDLIVRASRKSATLIELMDDWLTLARVEGGSLKAAEEPVELGAVLRDALAEAREGPTAGDVRVELAAPRSPVRVLGDADALREMLANLVGNALKYTPHGGAVTLGLAQEHGYATVTVADTGPGIPPGELEVIFEPFFRGDEAKKQDGTGLGLSIARQIAQVHGGRISVRSEPGEGTTFQVHLPLAGHRGGAPAEGGAT